MNNSIFNIDEIRLKKSDKSQVYIKVFGSFTMQLKRRKGKKKKMKKKTVHIDNAKNED